MSKQTDEQYLDELMARERCDMETTPGFRGFVLDVMAMIGERPRPGDLHSMHMAYKAGSHMAKGKPMLAEYLASEQAREDVRVRIGAALGTADEPWTLKVAGVGELAISGTCGPFMKLVIWKKTDEDADDEDAEYIQLCAAYYRPDGDRYVVTDLGEGVRALRLRTGKLYQPNVEVIDPGTSGVVLYNDEIMYCDEATATGSIRFSVIQDLPDAICRVMLASLRVAEVLP